MDITQESCVTMCDILSHCHHPPFQWKTFSCKYKLCSDELRNVQNNYFQSIMLPGKAIVPPHSPSVTMSQDVTNDMCWRSIITGRDHMEGDFSLSFFFVLTRISSLYSAFTIPHNFCPQFSLFPEYYFWLNDVIIQVFSTHSKMLTK